MSDGTTDWESTARRSINMALTEHRIDLHDSVSELSDLIRDGELITPNELRTVRNELFAIQRVIETCVVPHVDGAEPWERFPEELAVEKLTDHLSITEDDINLAIWLRSLRERGSDPAQQASLTSMRSDLGNIIDQAREDGVSNVVIAATLLRAIDDIDG